MKKIFGVILAGSILVTTSFANFSDVDETHWANSAITKMKDSGILSGYNDGTFKPGKNITLAEFATIFSKIFEIEPDFSSNYFPEVKNDHWAKGYLEAIRAYINPYYDSIGEAIGVTEYSYLEGLTGDMEITREAFIYAVSRIYGYDTSKYIEGEEKTLFTDYDEILFPREMVLAYKNGVISGENLSGKVYIRPKRKITRAEASAIFNNLLKYEATRITNKDEETNIKARYGNIIKGLKEKGIDSYKTYVYDTQEVLTNSNFKLSENSKNALQELLNILLNNYEYEIVEAKFNSFNNGYVKVKANTYDISNKVRNLVKASLNNDENKILSIVEEVKNSISNKSLTKTEKEEIVDFAKFDGEWKIILK